MPNKKYKVGGLFSGVGGIELGFQKTNKFKIAWSTDVDPYAAKTYRANFKHKFYEENMVEISTDLSIGTYMANLDNIKQNREHK